MKYELQKIIKKETDKLYPKREGDVTYNLQRCKHNAMRLQEESKKKGGL